MDYKRKIEILELVNKSILDEAYLFTGMCSEFNVVYCKELMTEAEYNTMMCWLNEFQLTDDFWWAVGHKEPRIQWIKNQIKLLKEKFIQNEK